MSVYNDLVYQFEKLSDEEKNSLFIYKSKLGIAINGLSENEEELEQIYNYYQKILSSPANLFMKMTVFKDLPLDSFEKFKDYISKIDSEVQKLSTKLSINDGVTVYRAVSIKENESLKSISKTNIISTSMDINECFKFFIQNKDYKHYLYQINLEKNSPVAICPYAILYNHSTNQVTLTKKTDQKELILNKNEYEFTESLTTNTTLANGMDVNIIVVDAKNNVKNSGVKK